jgi:hypothetical protein
MVIENFDFYLKDAARVDLDTPLRYATDFVLVPTDSPVLPRIETDRRWQQVYRDDEAVIFARPRAAAEHAWRPSSTTCPRVMQ